MKNHLLVFCLATAGCGNLPNGTEPLAQCQNTVNANQAGVIYGPFWINMTTMKAAFNISRGGSVSQKTLDCNRIGPLLQCRRVEVASGQQFTIDYSPASKSGTLFHHTATGIKAVGFSKC